MNGIGGMNELQKRFDTIKRNENRGFKVLAAQDKLHDKDDVKLDRHLLIDTPYRTATGEHVYGFAIQPLRIKGSEPNTVELYAAVDDMSVPHDIDRYCLSPNHSLDLETSVYFRDKAVSAKTVTNQLTSVAESLQYGEVVHEYDDWKEVTEARFKKMKLPLDGLGSDSYNKYIDTCMKNMSASEPLHCYINADITNVDTFRLSDPEVANEINKAFEQESAPSL